MQLTHSFTVASDVETTWAHFMDLERVGMCFPGARITEVSGDDFAGTVKVKLGPIALQYAGTGRFVERDHDDHVAVIEARGKDSRGNGTAGATVTMRLQADPDGGTRAQLVTDLAVTGKPAQFGRGVMQDVSDKLLGQFLACLEHQLSGDFDAESGTAGLMPTGQQPTAAALGAVAAADALARATTPSDPSDPIDPDQASGPPSAHVLGALARGNALAASVALADTDRAAGGAAASATPGDAGSDSAGDAGSDSAGDAGSDSVGPASESPTTAGVQSDRSDLDGPDAHTAGIVAATEALVAATAPAAPPPSSPSPSAHVLGALARGDALAASARLQSAASGADSGPASRVGLGAAGRAPYQSADALDLGSAVWPVLAKTYGPMALVGALGLLAGVLIGRRRRR